MTASHSFADLLAEEKSDVITPLDLGEGSLDLKIETDNEACGFPPAQFVPDTIIWWNNIDWDLQRERARAGLNNIGLVLAVIGTKLNDLGTYLSKV
jgi:hypothetical protein